ncbi:glycosyltransferase [Polaribacter sp. Asnod1-A03]|uniref:CgeB family protein n=1 Tax=Polaribacter sp. Asnod1-A03 TaxID=3160581 RepID=UPI00386BAE30
MKILSVGTFRGESNTCLHRNWALEKYADKVDRVETSKGATSLFFKIAYHLFQLGLPIKLPDGVLANKNILKKIKENYYDVIWIDKGIVINKGTLNFIKKNSPKTKIVSYSPDNMALRHNQSQNYLECIPLYDYIFTNKSYILEDMKSLGAKSIQFVNNSYEAAFHYPRSLSKEDIKRLGGDIGFIGTWEEERCKSILYLVDHGVPVKVFGGGKWNDYKDYSPHLEIVPGVYSEDYSKALQALKISLCFLRKINFDQQTTRSVEIPACKGFMMAERTEEHQMLFKEKEEAVFFNSNEELLQQCVYYLENEKERLTISEAGWKRCQTSGYSNEKTVAKMLNIALGKND